MEFDQTLTFHDSPRIRADSNDIAPSRQFQKYYRGTDRAAHDRRLDQCAAQNAPSRSSGSPDTPLVDRAGRELRAGDSLCRDNHAQALISHAHVLADRLFADIRYHPLDFQFHRWAGRDQSGPAVVRSVSVASLDHPEAR